MVKLENIYKSYSLDRNKIEVLKDINLTINKGEFISLTGVSGSGKSTLLNILGLLDVADSGKYSIENKIMDLSDRNNLSEYRSKYIGFIFQSFNLIKHKTAIENVALPLIYQGVKSKDALQRAEIYLEKMNIQDLFKNKPNQLSGGQRQRVAIARSLITNPNMILADEPTGSLDSKTSYEIMDILKRINQEGNTIVLVTHDKEISQMTSKSIELIDGTIEIM